MGRARIRPRRARRGRTKYFPGDLHHEGGGTRTHYLEIKSLLLYPLSYAPSSSETWGAQKGNSSPELRVSPITRCRLILSLLMVGAAAPAAAQGTSPERWQILLEAGDYLWDLRLGSLQGDSLAVSQADSNFSVPVMTMRELRLIRKTVVRLGDGDGGAVSFRALTGGDDEIYDLGGLEFAERLRVLREVLARHPAAP